MTPNPIGRARLALIALSLLSACAAGVPGRPDEGADTGPYGAFLDARYAAGQGDLAQAADYFLRAHADDPGDAELARSAFVACLVAGRPEASQLARQMPDNVAAHLLLADDDARAGRWEQAAHGYGDLPPHALNQVLDVLQPLLIAWSQQGGGDTDAALATLAPFVKGHGLRGVYALHAAMIADLAGRTADATRLYAAAREGFGAPSPRLAQILASWQARQGDAAGAARTLQSSVENAPAIAIALPAMTRQVSARPVATATDGLAEAYLTIAAALGPKDHSGLGLVMLRLALGLRPDFTAARVLLADAMDASDHPQGALQALAPIRASDPLIAVIRLRRAALEQQAGHLDAALATLRGLEAAYPDSPIPYVQQGDLLRQSSRWADAAAAYDQAITRAGATRRSTWTLFYARGVSLAAAHDWPKAQSDIQHALTLAPDQPAVLNFLGYSWADRGEHLAQARKMIDKAAAEQPDDGAILDSLGWVQLRQGQKGVAVKTLEHAVELEPEDATINGHLGDAYWAAGRKQEARFQWTRALTLHPDAAEVPKLKDKLREDAARTP